MTVCSCDYGVLTTKSCPFQKTNDRYKHMSRPEGKARGILITKPLSNKCTQRAFSRTAGRAINSEAYIQTLDDNNPILCKSRCLAKSRTCSRWTDSGLWISALGPYVG